ncbi:uncharacterized protein LOC127749159 isoform X2 [Frankliniella occidentalis]|uniref:Gustatory receptor n=1 Tax=Frankliniella occidentalis TaxID=133901 RepID=A0A9C6U6T8_FRAOC|nr:uncharacterized protein LOC127749159 isoform X2 [Frankliniella occidentalis]
MDAVPAAEHEPPAPPGWVRHWARQWRALLALLSVFGMNCTRGWPPRPWRGLRWYGSLVLAVRILHDVQALIEIKTTREDIGKINYIVLLCLYEMSVKLVGSVVSQVVMLVRPEDVCLVTECMLLYSRVGQPAVWGAVALVGPTYVVGLVLVAGPSTYAMATTGTWMQLFSYMLGDLVPSVVMMLVGIMQLLMTALYVGFATDESSNVKGWVSEAEASKCPAHVELLRKLRVRQQFLHDMVLHHNSAFGWCYLSCLAHVFMETVLCLYLGLAQLRQVADPSEPLLNAWFCTWGAFELTMFCGMCILGQKLVDHHGQMYCLLRGFLVSNPQLCTEAKLELQGFAQQIRRQDNRPGIFGLIHYDLKTMKAGFASTVTYIIVLSQFEPAVGH